jgi:hypothetical protein
MNKLKDTAIDKTCTSIISLKNTIPLIYFQCLAKNNINMAAMQTPGEGAKFYMIIDLRRVAR